MKEQKYVVKTRYEYRTNDGKDWTSWFISKKDEMTEAEAKEYIKTTKVQYADIDKKTKLNHEYMLVPIEEYKKEQEEINATIEKAQRRDEAYYASDEWKQLKHKKYVAKKERKAKQEEYLKMKQELEKQNI